MKKILVISFVLIISIGSLFSAQVGTPQPLVVYGKIGAGTLAFSTTQVLTPANRIDLINNASVQPGQVGVTIGSWNFEASNQPNTVAYTVTYTYPELSNGTESIGYELLALGETIPVKASGDISAFTAGIGTVDVSQDIAVRLTSAGATTAAGTPASDDFSSTITLTLTTGT